MSEKLCTVSLLHELLSGRNAARKNSTAEDSRLCSRPSAARFLAPTRLVAVSIISRPTASVCAIRSSMPKVCVLPPAWSRPDARWLLGRASNAPACTGPNKAPTPSLLSAAQNSVVGFKTSGSADQNAGPRDPSLSWRAPSLGLFFAPCLFLKPPLPWFLGSHWRFLQLGSHFAFSMFLKLRPRMRFPK